MTGNCKQFICNVTDQKTTFQKFFHPRFVSVSCYVVSFCARRKNVRKLLVHGLEQNCQWVQRTQLSAETDARDTDAGLFASFLVSLQVLSSLVQQFWLLSLYHEDRMSKKSMFGCVKSSGLWVRVLSLSADEISIPSKSRVINTSISYERINTKTQSVNFRFTERSLQKWSALFAFCTRVKFALLETGLSSDTNKNDHHRYQQNDTVHIFRVYFLKCWISCAWWPSSCHISWLVYFTTVILLMKER